MREGLKKLTGEGLVYGLGQVSGRAVQLLLVPVLTRVLAKDAYGVSDLVLAYLQTALLVLVFGMDGALARFYYQEADDAARRRMVSSSLLFRLALGSAVGLAIALAAGPIAGGLLGSPAYVKYVRLGALTLPFSLMVLFALDVLRVTFQPWKFIVVAFVQTAVVGAVTLVLVLDRHLGVAGVFYGRLAGDAAAALLGLVLARHHIRAQLDRPVLRRMLAYGAPLVPAAFAFGIIGSIDRWALQRWSGLGEVAEYAVAAKFFAVVTMGVSAFQLAWFPFAYQRVGDPGAPRLYAQVGALYLALGAVAALAVGLFAPEVIAIAVPTAYAGAAAPARWLVFAALLQGAYYVASLGIGLGLETRRLGLTAGAGAATAFGANLLLVPSLGAEGAALATLAGSAVAAGVTFAVAQRIYPLPYRTGTLIVPVVLGLTLTAVLAQWAPAGVLGLAARLAAVAVAAAFAGVMVQRTRTHG